MNNVPAVWKKSQHIGSDYEDYDTLDSIKLLAITHDAMNDVDSAINEYESALAMEDDTSSPSKKRKPSDVSSHSGDISL